MRSEAVVGDAEYRGVHLEVLAGLASLHVATPERPIAVQGRIFWKTAKKPISSGWHIHDAMYARTKETATVAVNEERPKVAGLYHANQVAAFDYSERQAAFAKRIKDCVSRAFHAIGAGSQTEEIIYWNLYVTRSLERDDIMNKPSEFLEGVKAIYGEAGIRVFEYMLTREIKREFGITAEFDGEPIRGRAVSDIVNLIAYAVSDSPDSP
jgi:hypothetical protein